MKQYINGVFEKVKARNAHEPEFLQAVEEVFVSLEPVLAKRPEWVKANILERIVEPERQIMFRVPWVDDNLTELSDLTKVESVSITLFT